MFVIGIYKDGALWDIRTHIGGPVQLFQAFGDARFVCDRLQGPNDSYSYAVLRLEGV